MVANCGGPCFPALRRSSVLRVTAALHDGTSDIFDMFREFASALGDPFYSIGT